eukprot:TRINITY_DN402_c0_g2_i1.p1 TRINITY_DN402_c0_g2~~TRINITY_DN402_c0_g2_i1.p1  ORF type:complete len:331 (-),score=131.87 TRINITY_DN402_c0_g2_i1:80-1072(-)
MVDSKKKEIYSYKANWLIYGMNWSIKPDQPFRLAIGSFLEEHTNEVQIIQLNEETGEFVVRGNFDHPYPTTKIAWIPDKLNKLPDLLATTSDYLRLWEVTDSGIKSKCVLNNQRNSEYCSPLTSFDWNETDPAIIGTSSIDTTCTIWNIEKQQAITQLIAHDKEVFDIAFARGTDVFATVGADGSLRMFDLRSLEHSTIIYESADSPELNPLLRLCWNKQDDFYLATLSMDSPKAIILDIRMPSVPAAELFGHNASLNAIAWAPHSSCHICTAGDDKQALIWDLSGLPKPIEEPILAYNAEGEINQLQWSSTQVDWIAIAFDSKLEILRV